MSQHKPETHDKLPEPDNSEIPTPPDHPFNINELKVPPGLNALPNQDNIYAPGSQVPERPYFPPGTQGPVAPNLRISSHVLKKAAGKVDRVYNAFYKAAASLEESTETAAKGLGPAKEEDSPQTPSALTASHKNWERQAGVVAAWLAHISNSLRLAADTHTKNDQGVRDSFTWDKDTDNPYLKYYPDSTDAPATSGQPSVSDLYKKWGVQ